MSSEITIDIPAPNAKQRMFLDAATKYVAYGGARGGGKSWVVRVQALRYAFKYPGIEQVIVRHTYDELYKNHIKPLLAMVPGEARQYNDSKKELRFPNGSILSFSYCSNDKDLDHFQGVEYDVMYIDEATQYTEEQFRTMAACVRSATEGKPRRIYLTCNPGGIGHTWMKRLFIDRTFNANERAEEYSFIQARAQDNKALMRANPDYIPQLEALPPKKRAAWLDGDWDIFEGQFFEDFQSRPDMEAAREHGANESAETLTEQHRWTHVIEPFEVPRGWNICRSYDFGYGKPFSCAWWAVDFDGTLYRIMELYGCTKTANEGVRWTPDQQFRKIRETETTHPWLKGKSITGVADPAIWDSSRGESIAETAARYGVYFTPGDNNRIPGWMQCHYRLQFDENGYSRMYVFSNCKAFIRTVPLMLYSSTQTEDLDTKLEDHVCDEWRYMCMSRPVKPIVPVKQKDILSDPLDQFKNKRR